MGLRAWLWACLIGCSLVRLIDCGCESVCVVVCSVVWLSGRLVARVCGVCGCVLARWVGLIVCGWSGLVWAVLVWCARVGVRVRCVWVCPCACLCIVWARACVRVPVWLFDCPVVVVCACVCVALCVWLCDCVGGVVVYVCIYVCIYECLFDFVFMY